MLLRMFLPVLSLLFSSFSFCQQIGSLSTDSEALAFVNRQVRDNFNTIVLEGPHYLKEQKIYMDHIRQSRPVVFEKADFDNNGHIDLLFNGYYRDCLTPFVILAFGNDSFQVRSLNVGLRERFCMARVIMMDGRPCIRMLEVRSACGLKAWSFCPYDNIDTLVFAFDDFIERKKPAAYSIKKIKYCVASGMDPIAFQLTITQDSIVLLSDPGMTIRIPVDSGGIFTVAIDTGMISGLVHLLNYMNFSDLQERYTVTRTDQLEGEIHVTFDDGRIKRVSDYGLMGTHGLSILHNLFFELREKQLWKKIRPVEGTFIHLCED